ncbi:MAG: hypothetical protein CGU29_08015 [Candidatus Dactylopiibacterium carminicum]|uniref:OmpA family protein n=1 Tax=Candidatus Dactylopiibacterium carminicum TaxID=857335 RepID=A0A272ETE3_9RHOO|nr:OmpA family protein [Candidatus Dactylopiibacterium carminicum]KAF7599365.1 OmpA family protein [Candidatus Dactylopiibacterium carminicum]PAS93375.1 MAG: hypothetical protein CGU29_08015 [Candidatus Dactylopiibacterium carminicum]PAS99375.1 MAG: hypothetical protein BSR46_08395 [Candidatus Dactylopiibacterium carminicum]
MRSLPTLAGLPARLNLFAGTLLLAALTACQTPPAAPLARASLQERQVAALVRAGFRLTDGGWALDLDSRILFDTDSDHLGARSQATIARIAQTLIEADIDKLSIEGHTDNTGGESYNLRLSQRRAEAVARAIAEQGIPYANIQQSGLGSAHPVADNSNENGRAQNRRVAIIVPIS